MKKYVILTPSIRDIGGAQMYVRNKIVYLQNRGWIVDLISAQKGIVYISELKKYDLIIPELNFNCYYYSKKKQEKVVSIIVKRILDNNYDEIVIESTCISESTWAEVVAERCKARHFTFLLQEDNKLTSYMDKEFVKFKFARKELASINVQSLYNMFASFYPISMEESSKYYLPAWCNNVEEDIDSEWIYKIKERKYDFLVGCLSRLDKPFIMPSLKSFINYVNKYPDKRFLFVMLGGAPHGSGIEKNIRLIFQPIKNAELIITGYIFPVSTRLLEMFDVFFTSAGSSRVCMRSGVPTITIDGNDFMPIGVLGRTTNNLLFRDKEKEIPLDFSYIMDKVLVDKTFLKLSTSYNFQQLDFSSHDVFLKNMIKPKLYFSYKKPFLEVSEKKLSTMLRLIGAKNYISLSILKKHILSFL